MQQVAITMQIKISAQVTMHADRLLAVRILIVNRYRYGMKLMKLTVVGPPGTPTKCVSTFTDHKSLVHNIASY